MSFTRWFSVRLGARKSASWLSLFLAALPLLTAPLPAQPSAPEPATARLHFLVLSDWGGKGGTTQVAVAEQMGRTADAQHSRFVITCGDNYHDKGISSADSPRWKSQYEDIYRAPSLMIPWYASLGNHDNLGSADGEIAYSQKSPRWKMPARYYAHTESIDGTNQALFVHLDTSLFVAEYRNKRADFHLEDQDPDVQLQWLESVLAQSPARWKIVVGHHPIYAAAPAHGDTKELIKSVLPVLEKHGVRLYFCGHDHVLQHLVHGQVNFFVCGGGSSFRKVKSRRDVRFGAASAGFLAMTLTATEAEATFIDETGKELYRTAISPP